MSDLTDFFGEPIAVYTMTEALDDGVLVDAGPISRDLFTWPVLLTAAAWSDCVAWTEGDSECTGAHGQSETGRLWDVLWMSLVAIRRTPHTGDGAPVEVDLYRISRAVEHSPEEEAAAEKVQLKATIAAHDDGSPVLVISLPEED